MAPATALPRRNGQLVHAAKTAVDFDGQMADACVHNRILRSPTYKTARRAQMAAIFGVELNEGIQKFLAGGCGQVPRWIIRKRPVLPTSTKHRPQLRNAVRDLVEEFSNIGAKKLSAEVKKTYTRQLLAYLREAIARSQAVSTLVQGY